MQTPPIHALLFDVGGVILRTEDPAPREALARQYGMSRADLEKLVFASPAALAAERGEADETAVWDLVARTLRLSAPQLTAFREQFWAGDCVDTALLAFLAEVRPRVRTGLLSNAWTRDLRALLCAYGAPADLLDRAVEVWLTSSMLGARKPDPRAFAAALAHLGASAGQTVFVDDFVENVEGARRAGLVGVHFQTTAQTLETLRRLLENAWSR
ncbi:HAD-IA family hydrolase [Anaerolinea sp.]|uniref:HAD-IA family hydrolase n=1 Tax=Anaerolinea sp. TaxID=1872519 RepID=UPI002ACDC081|nr:HAD-IA family hydrolase [Anaerolinea sp.]